MELVEGEDSRAADRARADSARRGAADRAADRRGARGRARSRHHPSRSEAREHQGPSRRHREGARLRPREGDRSGRRARVRDRDRTRRRCRFTRPRPGIILGTAAYMSRSRRAGKAVDKRTDIWAFGVRALRDAHRPTRVSRRRCDRHDRRGGEQGAGLGALPAEMPSGSAGCCGACSKRIRKRRLDSAAAVRIEIDDAMSRSSVEAARSSIQPLWIRMLPWGLAAVTRCRSGNYLARIGRCGGDSRRLRSAGSPFGRRPATRMVGRLEISARRQPARLRRCRAWDHAFVRAAARSVRGHGASRHRRRGVADSFFPGRKMAGLYRREQATEDRSDSRSYASGPGDCRAATRNQLDGRRHNPLRGVSERPVERICRGRHGTLLSRNSRAIPRRLTITIR